MRNASLVYRAVPIGLGIAATVCLPQTAHAASTSGLMPVSALSLAACVVVPTPMVFGTLSQLDGNPNDSSALVTVTCTPGTTFDVGMNDGLYASGGVRRMKALLTADYVEYRLYSDAARSVPWGNVIGTNTVSGTAGLLPSVMTVYGRVPGNAPVAPLGSYADTVTVTVTF